MHGGTRQRLLILKNLPKTRLRGLLHAPFPPKATWSSSNQSFTPEVPLTVYTWAQGVHLGSRRGQLGASRGGSNSPTPQPAACCTQILSGALKNLGSKMQPHAPCFRQVLLSLKASRAVVLLGFANQGDLHK